MGGALRALAAGPPLLFARLHPFLPKLSAPAVIPSERARVQRTGLRQCVGELCWSEARAKGDSAASRSEGVAAGGFNHHTHPLLIS